MVRCDSTEERSRMPSEELAADDHSDDGTGASSQAVVCRKIVLMNYSGQGQILTAWSLVAKFPLADLKKTKVINFPFPSVTKKDSAQKISCKKGPKMFNIHVSIIAKKG